MPYIHTFNPIALQIGPLAIRWYGLVYLFGFLYAYWLAIRAKMPNMTRESIEWGYSWLVVGIIAGGRIGYFLFNQPAQFLHPWELFYIWHGGMSFHGAFIGAMLVAIIYSRKYRINIYHASEVVLIATALSLSLGRVANFINAELVGKVANVPWCVIFPGYAGCRHPYQLYQAAILFLLYLIILPVWKRYRFDKPGVTFWLFFFLYGLFRLITDYWRDDPTWLLGLQMGQWASILMMVIGLPYLLRAIRGPLAR